jgi:hypothetical protein
MRIKYTGPANAFRRGGRVFRHGQAVDVSDSLARELLELESFAKAEPTVPEGRGSAARAADGVETR